jgi:PAS domain-containing protein
MEKAPTNISTICFDWEATFNTFIDPVSIHDNQFTIVKINTALASLLKEKPENILARKCHQVIHGTDKPLEGCPHVQALKSRRSTGSSSSRPILGLGSATPILSATFLASAKRFHLM